MRQILIASCLFVALLSKAQDEKGLLIRPYILEYKLDKGQVDTRHISIFNGMNRKAQFSLYINDWLRDTTGAHVYRPVNGLPHSCSRWISLENDFIEVGPGETKDIPVKVAIPDSADAVSEMKWSMLFIETISETRAPVITQNGLSSQIENKMRLGIHIYQTPPSLSTREMKLVSLAQVPDSVLTYQATCINTGNVQLQCKGSCELICLDDGSKSTVKPIDFPMFPGQKRLVNFSLPEKIKKGRYTMLITIDAGEDLPLEAAQKEIVIK